MDILYQSDNNYAPYMGISMQSLLMNNSDDGEICFHILDGGISEENKERLIKTCAKYDAEIRFIDCKELEIILKGYGLKKYRGSYATYYKLYVREKIPSHIKRMLYIDCDTIVQGSIQPLFTMDMGTMPIAMVEDLLIYQYKVSLGFAKNEKYYNAGVILFDWNNWDCAGVTAMIRKFMCEFPMEQLLKHEQDILNLVLRNRIMPLQIRYNVQSILAVADIKTVKRVYRDCINISGDELAGEYSNSVIAHFLSFGGEQPWHKDNIHPYSELYHAYKAKSLWSDEKELHKERGLIVRIERVLYRCVPKIIFLYAFKLSHDIKREI